MKFLGRHPPESSLPASDRAPSEGEGETGGAGRTFSIFPANHHRKAHNHIVSGFVSGNFLIHNRTQEKNESLLIYEP